MKDFISNFAFGGLVSIGIGSAKASDAIYIGRMSDLPDMPADKDVFFSPAMRKSKGDTKEDVLGTIALWAEIDDLNKPRWTLPPTVVVFSGHGWHCYWFLREPCLNVEDIEKYNKLLMTDVGGDNCWNANRVLRVPGTTNNKHLKEPNKYSEPTPVEIKYEFPVQYGLHDFDVLENLSKKTRHKIATGDSRGHRSRSERDWAIMTDLVASGASDGLIFMLFDLQPCGDKHRETNTQTYLKHSLERIREKAPVLDSNEDSDVRQALIERDDGYWVPMRKGMRRVSTFVLDPQILLDGSSFEIEDSLVCNVRHDRFLWEGVVFNRDAFNSVSKMARLMTAAAWQWLGNDDSVKELLPYLLEKLKEKGLPRVVATKTLGLHNIHGRWLFLGDKQVLSADDLWYGFEGPLAWMSSRTEYPKLELAHPEPDVRMLGQLIPQLNEPSAIWPMIGWYTAAMLKPWIETRGYRFPILNVAGTRGSGKTTLIQRVFMPLWGQPNPIAYDSGTTKFVTLAIMGSSNAVPVAFSEFRVDAVQRFLRFVLLSYDTGHDPRGRADQSTQDYPLQAPFTLDGEDLIDDPAARERIVVARLHPETIEEGSPSYNVFKEMGRLPSSGGAMIQKVLKLEHLWEVMLHDAREMVFDAFPGKVPDRVRNNHVIAYFGCLLWSSITQTEPPPAEVMRQSILSVFDIKAGRSRTLCDDMVEHVINKANSGSALFKYKVEEGTFWFQFVPAYDDWVSMRRRQGRGTLERDSMKSQLAEAPYYVQPKVLSQVFMYGINLNRAVESGLDVPSVMNAREIKISF